MHPKITRIGLAALLLLAGYAGLSAATAPQSQGAAQSATQQPAQSRGWQLLLRNEMDEWGLRGRASGGYSFALAIEHMSPEPFAQNSTGPKVVAKAEVRVTYVAGLISQTYPFQSHGPYWETVFPTGLLDPLGSNVSLYVWLSGADLADDSQANVYTLEKLQVVP